jgi:hypothetical protein
VQLDFTAEPAVLDLEPGVPVVVRLRPNRRAPPAIVAVKASVPGVEARVLDAHSFEVVLRKADAALDNHYVLVQTGEAMVQWPTVPLRLAGGKR